MSDTATLQNVTHNIFTVDNVKDMSRVIIDKKIDKYMENSLTTGNKENIAILENEREYLLSFFEDDPNPHIVELYNNLGYKYLLNHVSAIDMLMLYKIYSDPSKTFKNILEASRFYNFISQNIENVSAENTDARNLIVEFIVDIGHNTNRFSLDKEFVTTNLFGDEFTLDTVGYNRDIIVNILNFEYTDCSNMWEGKGKFKNRALLEHLKQSGL